MSGIKFEFKDNVTRYFTRLEELWDKEEKHVLKEMMISATGRHGDTWSPIAKRLMHMGSSGIKEYEYNPYLYMSGQDTSYWNYKQGEEKSEISANYSGMRGYRSGMDFMVWAEFSDQWKDDPYMAQQLDPFERTLNRDYAYYQETGQDEIAPSSEARHQEFVSEGLHEASEQKIPYTLNSQVGRILKML